MRLSGLSADLRTEVLQVRIPSQGTCLGCGLGSQCRGWGRSNHTLMFLSLSFSLPCPLSKNKTNKIFKKKKKREVRKRANLTCSPNYRHKSYPCELTGVGLSSLLVIISQYIHVPNHHTVRLKFIQRHIRLYFSKAGERRKREDFPFWNSVISSE